MTEEDRAALKRIEEKIDSLLAVLVPEPEQGVLLEVQPPYPIAAAVEAMHERRNARRR